MSVHERFTIAYGVTACMKEYCNEIGEMYYADNDKAYCKWHVLDFIDIWRLLECKQCDYKELQMGSRCAKCKNLL